MTLPKMKFLMSVGISVNGIQNTASNKSLTDRFSRNTLVIVRMRRFCTRVRITSAFPPIDNTKITEYSTIRISTPSGGGGGLPRGKREYPNVSFVMFVDPDDAVVKYPKSWDLSEFDPRSGS